MTFYLFSISLLLPIFPTLIKYSIEQAGNSAEETDEEVAIRYSNLLMAKNILDLVSLPAIGTYSDYVGRRLPMLFCLFSALVQMLLLIPPSTTGAGPRLYFSTLLASRVLCGVSDGVLVLLFSSLTDLSRGDVVLLPLLYGKVGVVFGKFLRYFFATTLRIYAYQGFANTSAFPFGSISFFST